MRITYWRSERSWVTRQCLAFIPLYGTFLYLRLPPLSISISLAVSTLQRKSHLCIPLLKIARPQSHSIYIFTGSVHLFSCSRLGRSIVGIYKSLTDIWMGKLGLQWPHNSFSGNMCFEFSVLVFLQCIFFTISFSPNMVTNENNFKKIRAANTSLHFICYRNRLLILLHLAETKHSE